MAMSSTLPDASDLRSPRRAFAIPAGFRYDRCFRRNAVEPTWHDGLSRKALVELVEGLLLAVDKTIPRLDAVAHHLSLMTQQGEEYEVLGGIGDQIADIGDELYTASDREKLREWGNQIDTPEKAH
jgi:hypothetical protein